MNSNVIVEAFDVLGGDPSDAVVASRGFSSTQSWVAWQSSQVAVTGAAALAVPGAHLAAMTADVAFLLHKMSYCSWGIGALHDCDVEGKDDVAVILALWGGAVSDEDLAGAVRAAAAGEATVVAGALGAGAAGVAAKAGGKAAAKVAVVNPQLAGKGLGVFGPMVVKKAFGVYLPPGTVTAGKFLVKKVAPKLAPKLTAKMAAKGTAGWIPLVGPLVGASVNAYIVAHTAGFAESYYRHKRQFQEVLVAQEVH